MGRRVYDLDSCQFVPFVIKKEGGVMDPALQIVL